MTLKTLGMGIAKLVTKKSTKFKAGSREDRIKWYQKAAKKKIYSDEYYEGYKPPKGKK
jgi:hypothetical protein